MQSRSAVLQTVAASSWAAVRAGAASSSSSIFMAVGRWWLNDGGVGGVGWSVQVWSLPPPAIQRHIQPRDPDIHRGFGGGNAPYTIMEQNGTHRELALGLGHGFGALVTSAAFLGHLLQRFGRTGGQFSAHRHTAVTNGRRCSRCRPPSTSCGRSHLRRAPSSRPSGSRRPRHKLRTKLRCTREVRRRRRRRGRLMIEHKRVIG